MSLDEMQARCDAATPGPWKLKPVDDHKRIIFGPNGNSWGTDVGEIDSDDADYDEAMRTAEFVSHARTDMPRLIAALRVAMEALDGIESGANSFPPHRSAREALARVAAILEGK